MINEGEVLPVKMFLTSILIVALIISVVTVIRKRRKQGISGIKTALTSICFYLIVIINLLALWFDLLGLWSWANTVVLLLLAAYFTKYLKPAI
jgi:Ca2+/Na+ antiporter